MVCDESPFATAELLAVSVGCAKSVIKGVDEFALAPHDLGVADGGPLGDFALQTTLPCAPSSAAIF